MRHQLTALILALTLGVVPAIARAADPSTLTVNGQGAISKAPDTAFVEIELVTSDLASAAKATSENDASYASLRDRLNRLGVHDDAIRTTSFDVRYVARPAERRQPLDAPAIPQPIAARYGYVATRSVGITAPRVDASGTIVDAAVAVGANVDGVRFGLADRRAAVTQALAAAVNDAQAQAQAVAAAAHLRISGIKSIEVGGTPAPIAFVARAAANAPSPTEIAPSPLEIRASVTVTYVVAP